MGADVSNETTTHEPMVMERFTLLTGGGRGDYREETVCVSCWVGCDDDLCTEPHGNAPWPCEVARLRERVAVLEAENRHLRGSVNHLAEMVTGYGDDDYAALSQADDGGRA